ncbi:MAG: AAA family ATPase [Polyangiales bacterium]
MSSERVITISPALGEALDVARGAGIPVLLSGSHGIGKSQYLDAYAHSRGCDSYVLDLSLLEATDLTGLPYLADGRTRFAPPATLPPGDATRPCVLVLEELNRCDRSVRQPCLQLLTTRRLNDYRLPDGCFVAACVNPENAGYEVDAFDPALASRFITLRVAPARDHWVAWAREKGLHPSVVRFVERFSQAFERAPPRSWEQAARILSAGIALRRSPASLEPLLAAVLQPVTAKALLLELPEQMPEISPEALLRSPRVWHSTFQTWMARERHDMVAATLEELRVFLRDRPDAVPRKKIDRKGLDAILDMVPPDLAVPILDMLDRPEKTP